MGPGERPALSLANISICWLARREEAGSSWETTASFYPCMLRVKTACMEGTTCMLSPTWV